MEPRGWVTPPRIGGGSRGVACEVDVDEGLDAFRGAVRGDSASCRGGGVGGDEDGAEPVVAVVGPALVGEFSAGDGGCDRDVEAVKVDAGGGEFGDVGGDRVVVVQCDDPVRGVRVDGGRFGLSVVADVVVLFVGSVVGSVDEPMPDSGSAEVSVEDHGGEFGEGVATVFAGDSAGEAGVQFAGESVQEDGGRGWVGTADGGEGADGVVGVGRVGSVGAYRVDESGDAVVVGEVGVAGPGGWSSGEVVVGGGEVAVRVGVHDGFLPVGVADGASVIGVPGFVLLFVLVHDPLWSSDAAELCAVLSFGCG
jgi:hypothetical protein